MKTDVDEKKVLTEDRPALDSLSLVDLRVRMGVLTMIIREAQADGDPRWIEAARQQRMVNEALVRKTKEARHARGEPEPDPVVVGMGPARLVARRLSAWDNP
jgi:hypothetical protein